MEQKKKGKTLENMGKYEKNEDINALNKMNMCLTCASSTHKNRGGEEKKLVKTTLGLRCLVIDTVNSCMSFLLKD